MDMQKSQQTRLASKRYKIFILQSQIIMMKETNYFSIYFK